MKTKVKYLLLVGLLLMPSFVMAKESTFADSMGEVIAMELFITIHMTLFFHVPMAYCLSRMNPEKKNFKSILATLVLARIGILIIGNATIGFGMAAIDFFTVFIGTFIIVPITFAISNSVMKSKGIATNFTLPVNGNTSVPFINSSPVMVIKRDNISSCVIAANSKAVLPVEVNAYESTAVVVKSIKRAYRECLKCHNLNEVDNKYCTSCGTPLAILGTFAKDGYCPKCHAKLNPGVKYCTNCGLDLVNAGTNVTITNEQIKYVDGPSDAILSLSEDEILKKIIADELAENHFDSSMSLPGVRRRKLILTALFCLVTFLCLCLVFFHLPLLYYFVYIIFVIVYIVNMKNYDLNKYIIKEIKSRPDEKVSNIVASIAASAQKGGTRFETIAMFIVAIMLPFVIFSKPRIFYSKVDGGYEMRFYAFGWTDMSTATIPDTYKGEPVVSLRGNAFSNMYLLTEVNLPDSIVEIRGQAFKNDYVLKKVNMPEDLEYLGGGAFYNCKSLEEIEFYDNVTEIGGEAFYGASSLREVKLPPKLKEIRGNTFEECTSLKKINIPNSVTRIGGHAFYGDISLSEVTTSSDSQLQEIGSSAFRRCNSLKEIYLPQSTVVNTKAFKESPTMVKRYVNGSSGSNLSFNNYKTYLFYEGNRYSFRGDNGNNYSIGLDKVSTGSPREYSFSLTGGGALTTKFKIREGDRYAYVNENIYVEVVSFNGEGITIKVNYN